MKFSVVIPLYNKQYTIANTLTTVMKQTFQDFEVVIVNDGSTDNSVDIINNTFSDSRIRIINQENAGVSSARNRGIVEARGEWISFLDADDEWVETYLETVSEAISSSCSHQFNVGLVIAGRIGQDFVTKSRSCSIPNKYFGKIQIFDFFENPHVFAHISGTTVSARLLKENFDDWGHFVVGQKSLEDLTFIYSVALHTKAVYAAKPIAIYNGNVNGQVTTMLADEQRKQGWILFHNTLECNKPPRYFLSFMRYEFRHNVLQKLRNEDWEFISYIRENIDSKVLRQRTLPLEFSLYSCKILKNFSIAFILFTKLLFRLSGRSIVGKEDRML